MSAHQTGARPTKEKGQRRATDAGPQAIPSQHQHFASADAALQAIAEHDAHVMELIGRAAVAGFGTHITARDGKVLYIVTRWGMSREFVSLAGFELWLDRVAGARP